MADKRITDLPAADALAGTEVTEIAQLSTTTRISAGTISAAAADNSFNDSANGFVTAGFAVGDRVNVSGFTGNAANNLYVATVTALTAGKMTIGGADGDAIIDDAAGETVTIAKWGSRRSVVGGSAKVPPDLTAFTQIIGNPVTKKINGRGIRFTNTGAVTVGLHGLLRPVPAATSFSLEAVFEGGFFRRDGNGIALAILTTTGQLALSGQFLDNLQKHQSQKWGSSTSRSTVVGSIADGGQTVGATLQYTTGTNSYYSGGTDVDFLDLTNAERNNLGYTDATYSGVAAYAGLVYVQYGNLIGAGVVQAYRDWDFSFDLRQKART